MPEQTTKTLVDAISEVLETTFFLCLEPVDDQAKAQPGNEIIAHIRTVDEKCLRIVAAFSEPLLKKMADNVLDETDKTPASEVLRDVAREAVNMFAGAYLNRLDTTRRRKLSVPEILARFDVPAEGCEQLAGEVEGERLRAYLFEQNTDEKATR